MNHGLIPGGVSFRTGRQAVFFTAVNPMDNQDDSGETLCDLSTARIAPYRNTWRPFQNAVFWCNLKLAQQTGLQFDQTRSHAVVLYNTLLAEFIEKAICMKTKDLIYQRESVILRPRVALRVNSQSGSQDLPVQEASTADYRVPGVSTSTVKLQDAQRQNNVTKLIDMFEKTSAEGTIP